MGCLDETSRQRLGDVRPPTLPESHRPARHDPEYLRNGVANLFLVSEPLRGWRAVTVSDLRTRLDFAACIKELVDVHYPEAEQIVLVLDQLNTHSPAEAKRLAARLEIHHTPKHGSWLNMAELDLSVLARQCLRQRLPDRATLAREVAAWAERRNASPKQTNGHFTMADARIKRTPLLGV